MTTLPQGVVLTRPDPCYLALIDNGLPTTMLAGAVDLAAGGACVSYIAGRAVTKKSDGGEVVVIGDAHPVAAGIVSDAIDAYSDGLFQNMIWDILTRFVRDKIRDPGAMDLAADMLARVL